MEALTKAEIIATLRKRGWKRIKWRWYKPKHPVGKNGVMLRDAASFEVLLASESLSEGPTSRAIAELGLDPWKLADQLEPWMKTLQWHGAPKVRQLCTRAGFNVKLLALHLECFVKRLKSDH